MLKTLSLSIYQILPWHNANLFIIQNMMREVCFMHFCYRLLSFDGILENTMTHLDCSIQYITGMKYMFHPSLYDLINWLIDNRHQYFNYNEQIVMNRIWKTAILSDMLFLSRLGRKKPTGILFVIAGVIVTALGFTPRKTGKYHTIVYRLLNKP